MKIIAYRKWYYSASGLILFLGIVSLLTFGMNFGIDFTGGSLMEVTFVNRERPNHDEVRNALNGLSLQSLDIKDSAEKNIIFRFEQIDEDIHQKLLSTLNASFPPVDNKQKGEGEPTQNSVEDKKDSAKNTIQVVDSEDTVNIAKTAEEVRFESIGPTIGKELRQKTFFAIILVVFSIILYIAWVFRRVSQPIASWKYGIVTIFALVHDIVIPVGIFSLLGRYYQIEVNAPFVAALLTILGYSVNDTIVVFDRIREKLSKQSDDGFEDLVDSSINETLVRSVNTSFTTLLALCAILWFGGETIRDFVLTLIIGIISGTYSSIFIASPLLVTWYKWSLRKQS
jgi:preprotein translocase subunit SecF